MDATKAIFKHTHETLVQKLVRLPHTHKDDVRGGTVDADAACMIVMDGTRWPVELARSHGMDWSALREWNESTKFNASLPVSPIKIFSNTSEVESTFSMIAFITRELYSSL